MSQTKPFIRITGILSAVMTAALLCFAPITVARAEDNSPIGTAVCIAKKSTNLRSEPSAKADVVAKLPARTFVQVYAQSDKWFQVEYNGIMAWGDSASLFFAENPPEVSSDDTDQVYTIYYQGDKQWKLSRSVQKKACIMSSYAIIINNMGIPANPRFIYESNRRNTSMNSAGLISNFGVTPVCALSGDSPYLSSFDGNKTYVADPGKNGVAAIKAAIDRNPEGVICYFKKGSRAHAIVACKYDGDTIYYSDPGRDFDELLTFDNTWVQYKHKMTYQNLNFIAALDTTS